MRRMPLSPDVFKKLLRGLQMKGPVVLLETQESGSCLFAAGMQAELSCFAENYKIRKASGDTHTGVQNPWQALRDFRRNYAQEWIFGYLGYDLKNHLETLASQNPDTVGAPDLWMICPRWVMRYDAGTKELLFEYECDTLEVMEYVSLADSVGESFEFELHTGTKADAKKYISTIKQAKRAIYEGDYYEINLSRQLKGRYEGHPYVLYERMRERGPVPFGAYLSGTGLQLCCASPERFLKREGNRLISQPIKGTAGVFVDEDVNKKVLQALKISEKNKAENLMIVDLVRHDFNSVCVPGSVTVPELYKAHRFATVFQMVSTVEGVLKPAVDAISAIAACFPMGSMTGAPKISAMKAIDSLESTKRGIYSGAIGYIDPEDNFDFNVVIRTAICKEGELYYSSGGAITSDSDPQEEWEETILKARAISECDTGGKLAGVKNENCRP